MNGGLAEQIGRVQERITAAARRAGRAPSEVTLVAVSKTQPPEVVAAAYRAGLHLFGENRVEEAGPKAIAIAELVAPQAGPDWHMIGHIQSRKAADVLSWASMIHSIDSVKLATRLSRTLRTSGAGFDRPDGAAPSLPILLEINVAGEESKYGLSLAEAPAAVEAIAALPGLQIEGLMTMAPIVPNPELARPVFVALRLLRDQLACRFPALSWRHLSMGMTDDFEVAIEEGATLVRIGRAIFETTE